MKKNLFFAAVALVALASCTSEEIIGDSPTPNPEKASNAIVFTSGTKATTRADIYGPSAATLLGNNFYVTGTKGTEADDSPTPTLVFDNYLVHYGVNTAGTTESNTSNWEYVGIDQATGVMTPENYNRVKLSSINGAQTIKYWDYSVPQYDFLAFSTGTFKAVAKTNLTGTGTDQIANDEIGVTAMKYGAGLDVASSVPTAYTFYLPSVSALENTFITDITEVGSGNYGKEVTLRFKNLGSKVRVALYETVPGYSVKNVEFYAIEGAVSPTDLGSGTGSEAVLISPSSAIPTKGQIDVLFSHVGNNNAGEEDYNKASATVTPGVGSVGSKSFGELTAQLVGSERDEVKPDPNNAGQFITETGSVFLGRTLTQASFAGSAAANFYQTVFPVSTSAPLVLRVDYTLVPIDGASETITVKGAKAVVPSTYTKWLPNYAYTYIFKISDNTNGWTGTTAYPAGLFPITFDAVVAEATDATAGQTTITTVATPTITTYQQGHNPAYDQTTTPPSESEYSKSVKGKDNNVRDVYVQVMDNSTSPATLKGDLNGTTPTDGTARSLLYAITGTAPISEATVMDALENQSDVAASGAITGRNGIILTPNTNIDATVTTIVNGPDDNPIDKIAGSAIVAGQVAKINMTGTAVPAGTYAYIYDYSTAAKVKTVIYQPITATGTLANGTKYVTTTTLDGLTATTTANEAFDKTFIYFSKTTNGTGTTTYSFVSVDGKKNLPAGLIKCPVGSLSTSDGSVDASAAAFVFTTYTRNDGKYAVKVIKIVA